MKHLIVLRIYFLNLLFTNSLILKILILYMKNVHLSIKSLFWLVFLFIQLLNQ